MLTDDLPGTGGRIRERLEDFVVEEIPAYLPSGEGDHVMVRVEKKGLTTDDVARALARAAGVAVGEVGFAGRKDKLAVTTQWLSVPGTLEPSCLAALQDERFTVLDATRHGNKLKTGHLRGNRFTVTVRGVEADAAEKARAIVDRIAVEGLPNAYGPQRFGRDGDNVRNTIGWIFGDGRPPKDGRRRKMLVSALQSHLFNRVVERRLERGLMTGALDGDVAKRHDTGGMFVVDDVEEVTERMRRCEVSPTGPMFGARMWWPERAALTLEEEVLSESGLSREDLERFKRDGRGSRRLLRVFPEDVTIDLAGDALTLGFTLDAGSFATTMLAEITKSPDLRWSAGRGSIVERKEGFVV